MSNIFDRFVSEGVQHAAPINTSEEGDASFRISDRAIEAPALQTPAPVREVTQDLLKHGFLEERLKPDLFRLAIGYESEIQAALEVLDLEMRIDAHRGVAFLAVAQTVYAQSDPDTPWLHPLVRRQRLTLEQSLLIALLRQAFALHEQESGIGQSEAKIAIDDLLPQFLAYFADSGSDAKNESRLLNLLDQLKPYGIVFEVDNRQEVTIRPLIAYVANPESLAAFLEVLKATAAEDGPSEDDG